MAKKAQRAKPARSSDEEATSGARPTWTGMISFGLVNVPVNLYTAVKPEIHAMNYLRKDDLCPISYKKVCRLTGEEVPFKDIVKGYEYRDGDFVVLSDSDFEKADVKKELVDRGRGLRRRKGRRSQVPGEAVLSRAAKKGP